MRTLDRTERAELDEVLDRLVKAFDPDRIYLDGSRVRGDDEADSDWDLMVVVAASDEPGYRRDQHAIRALGTVPFPAHVTVWTAAGFDSRVPLVASLPATIEREGSGSIPAEGDALGEPRDWLAMADDDLRSGCLLLDHAHIATALFHGQQAAEKAFKALLATTTPRSPRRTTSGSGRDRVLDAVPELEAAVAEWLPEGARP